MSTATMNRSRRLSISVCFFYVYMFWRQTQGGLTKLIPANETVPGLIIFGDSIVDTGNNNYITTLVKANFPPYGRDLNAGIPTGRFSNGKILSDFLAEELGIKELLPPYKDPTLQLSDLLTGVTFASASSGYDPLTSQTASVVSMSDQLEQFKEYISKLRAAVGEERTSFILAKSVFAVVAGSNDIANTYYTLHLRSLHYDISSYTDHMLNLASALVKDLYGLGVRRISVFNVPSLGCIPCQRTLNGGVRRECSEKVNDAANLFNSKLHSELNSVQTDLPNARLVYVDLYQPLLDIIENPTTYGFDVVNKGCCGSGNFEVSILCSKWDHRTCRNDSSYVFWDSYHPTEKAYKIIASKLLQH